MRKTAKKQLRVKRPEKSGLPMINPNAAGIDVGAREHYVAVPSARDPQPVRCFGAFTQELHRLAQWLLQCRIETVAMEATGVYWIPLYQMLESYGLAVKLVNARHVKHVPGRKTDVQDCQWLQQLESFGLLSGSFRPEAKICVLRSYMRQREMLIRAAGRYIQQMQKALTQMNLKLQHVISDLSGQTGLRIVRAIVAGERDRLKLAALKDRRIKSDVSTIAQALEGDYQRSICLRSNRDSNSMTTTSKRSRSAMPRSTRRCKPCRPEAALAPCSNVNHVLAMRPALTVRPNSIECWGSI